MRELGRWRAGLAGGVLAIGVLIAAAIGCDGLLGKELNPAFCAAHPEDPECGQQPTPDAAVIDAPPDVSTACMANSECTRSDNTGVCDMADTMMCVQCTASDDPCATALPATPVCIAKQCAKCTQHAHCKASRVCLPDGSCAGEALVAYVAPGGTGADCTKAEPCGTLVDA